jgi:hypothetical protein
MLEVEGNGNVANSTLIRNVLKTVRLLFVYYVAQGVFFSCFFINHQKKKSVRIIGNLGVNY